jgi:predicted phage-related endonuclease
MLNHEVRRQGIGASQVATILGISPWETPLALYHYIKHGKMKKDNASMKNGRKQEKVILDAYEAEKHIALERNQQVIDKTCEIFRCNLDGINWTLAESMGRSGEHWYSPCLSSPMCISSSYY